MLSLISSSMRATACFRSLRDFRSCCLLFESIDQKCMDLCLIYLPLDARSSLSCDKAQLILSFSSAFMASFRACLMCASPLEFMTLSTYCLSLTASWWMLWCLSICQVLYCSRYLLQSAWEVSTLSLFFMTSMLCRLLRSILSALRLVRPCCRLKCRGCSDSILLYWGGDQCLYSVVIATVALLQHHLQVYWWRSKKMIGSKQYTLSLATTLRGVVHVVPLGRFQKNRWGRNHHPHRLPQGAHLPIGLAPPQLALHFQPSDHGHNAHPGAISGRGLNVGGMGGGLGSRGAVLLLPMSSQDALGRAVVDVELKAGLLDGHVVVDDESEELVPNGFIDFSVLFGALVGIGGNGREREGFHEV